MNQFQQYNPQNVFYAPMNVRKSRKTSPVNNGRVLETLLMNGVAFREHIRTCFQAWIGNPVRTAISGTKIVSGKWPTEKLSIKLVQASIVRVHHSLLMTYRATFLGLIFRRHG